MPKAFPTARRLSTGEVELSLPAAPVAGWLAARTLLGGSARVLGHRRMAVCPDRVPAAIAVLEWYFGEVVVLAAEPLATALRPLSAGAGPLDGLPMELREKAFKALARVLHPDVGGSNEAFTKLQAWREG